MKNYADRGGCYIFFFVTRDRDRELYILYNKDLDCHYRSNEIWPLNNLHTQGAELSSFAIYSYSSYLIKHIYLLGYRTVFKNYKHS